MASARKTTTWGNITRPPGGRPVRTPRGRRAHSGGEAAFTPRSAAALRAASVVPPLKSPAPAELWKPARPTGRPAGPPRRVVSDGHLGPVWGKAEFPGGVLQRFDEQED